jgi:hypothetical protein
VKRQRRHFLSCSQSLEVGCGAFSVISRRLWWSASIALSCLQMALVHCMVRLTGRCGGPRVSLRRARIRHCFVSRVHAFRARRRWCGRWCRGGRNQRFLRWCLVLVIASSLSGYGCCHVCHNFWSFAFCGESLPNWQIFRLCICSSDALNGYLDTLAMCELSSECVAR